jgi:hypothetical protein
MSVKWPLRSDERSIFKLETLKSVIGNLNFMKEANWELLHHYEEENELIYCETFRLKQGNAVMSRTYVIENSRQVV